MGFSHLLVSSLNSVKYCALSVGGKKLNLELYKTQYPPTAEVYPFLAFCMMLIVSSF
jgi:hypothetical protein